MIPFKVQFSFSSVVFFHLIPLFLCSHHCGAGIKDFGILME